MNIAIMRPVIVDIARLEVYLGNYFDCEDLYFENTNGVSFQSNNTNEILEKFPSLNRNGGIYLDIDVNTGKIINWPDDWTCEFYDIKLVDTGKYILYDSSDNVVYSHEGYVPSILAISENGYGDYLEFEVSANGEICGWECNQELIENFMEQ